MKLRHILIFILFFYLWLSGSDTFNFHLDHGGAGDYISYNHLTNAFLAGKLRLLEEPDPRLLALKNPYDPSSRGGVGWHDATLYKGKYYLYFGATPAVLLYLPFKFFTGNTMTDRLASVIFMYGAFLFACAILIFLHKQYFPEIKKWKLYMSIAVVGVANCAPFIIREDNGIYNVAIACGVFFLTGAIYFFIKAIHKKESNLLLLFSGSLFLGLGSGARAQILLFGILLLFVLYKIRKDNFNKVNVNKSKELIALFLPYFVCLCVLALYNYLRFGNITEFGFRYQTGLYDFAKVKSLDINNIFIAPFFYLFNIPAFDSLFPYVHIDGPIINYPFLVAFPYYYGREPVVGIFTTIPFLFLPVIYFICQKYYFNQNTSNIKLPSFELFIILFTGIINLLLISMAPGSCMRYIAEFATHLILASCILWFYFDSRYFKEIKDNHILNKISVTLAGLSILFWTGLGIDEIRIRNKNRSDFVALSSFFKPITKILIEQFPSWEAIKLNVISIPITLQSYSPEPSENLQRATDGLLQTNWVVSGNRSAIIEAIPKEKSIIKSIWLLSRHTSLYEAWENLNVKCYLDGNLVKEESFSFPEASKKRIQHAKLDSVKTDRIELGFSKPVVINIEGKPVDPNSVNPGYTEILFEGE